MDADVIDAAVRDLEAARARGEYFPAAWFDRLSIDQAYRVQLALVRRRAAREGMTRVGWKVGLTAKAIQEQFGVHEPVFACLFDEGRKPSGHAFVHADLLGPGFENEVCVGLARDLAPGATRDDVAAAVEWIAPALEIVETRGPFSKQLALALADNGQQRAFVVADPMDPCKVPDLATVRAAVRVNGAEVGSGTGDAVLGHPYNSVVWLAARLADFGEHLRAGEVIMTGSFTRQFPISAGDRVETRFDGFGTVRASF